MDELSAHDGCVKGFGRSLRGRMRSGMVAGYVSGRGMAFGGHLYERHHPHRHLVLVLPHDVNADSLRKKLVASWLRQVKKAGGHALAAAQHWQEVEEGDDDEVIYYALSEGVRCGDGDEEDGHGLTVRDLSELAVGGDRRAAWRLQEFAAAMKGRRSAAAGGRLRLMHESEEAEDEGPPASGNIICGGQREYAQLEASGLLGPLMNDIGRAASDEDACLAAHDRVELAGLCHIVDWTSREHLFYGTARVYDSYYPPRPDAHPSHGLSDYDETDPADGTFLARLPDGSIELIVPPPPTDWLDALAQGEAERRAADRARRRAQRERCEARKRRIRAMAAAGDDAGYRAMVNELESYWHGRHRSAETQAERRQLRFAARAQMRSVSRTWRAATH